MEVAQSGVAACHADFGCNSAITRIVTQAIGLSSVASFVV